MTKLQKDKETGKNLIIITALTELLVESLDNAMDFDSRVKELFTQKLKSITNSFKAELTKAIEKTLNSLPDDQQKDYIFPVANSIVTIMKEYFNSIETN